MQLTHNLTICFSDGLFVEFPSAIVPESDKKFSFVRIDSIGLPNAEHGLVVIDLNLNKMSYRYDNAAVIANIVSVDTACGNDGLLNYTIEAENSLLGKVVLRATLY